MLWLWERLQISQQVAHTSRQWKLRGHMLNDIRRLGHRGRAISIMTEKISRVRTSHIRIEDRGRAISTHRRDVFDIATSRFLFPYLQGHFPNHLNLCVSYFMGILSSEGVFVWFTVLLHVPSLHHEVADSIPNFVSLFFRRWSHGCSRCYASPAHYESTGPCS